MTNQAKPEVTINLDRPRTLYFGFNAMADFERVTGLNALKLDWENLNITLFRVLLWACLRREDKDLTLDKVGDLLDFMPLTGISEKVQESMNLSVPVKSEDKAADGSPLPDPNQSGTG